MTFALLALLAMAFAWAFLRRFRSIRLSTPKLAGLWVVTLLVAFALWMLIVADVARGWRGTSALIAFNVILILCVLAGPALFVFTVLATINWIRSR
jgi:hypothetical protein